MKKSEHILDLYWRAMRLAADLKEVMPHEADDLRVTASTIEARARCVAHQELSERLKVLGGEQLEFWPKG